MVVRDTAGDKAFRIIVTILITIVAVAMVYPFIVLLSSSFSDPMAIMRGEVWLFPVRPTIAAYQMVARHPDIWGAYANTIRYTLVGTSINIVLTVLGAYPLSRKDLYGRNFFMVMFLFTMFFSGGMIPSFLLVRNLGMLDTMWALILPTAISVWNLIIMRTFFQYTIPDELHESAALDGANDLVFLIKVVIPLSGPIIAVMVLFYGVGHWNAWFSALLYIQNRSLLPLQMILREIIIQFSTQDVAGAGVADAEMVGEGVRFATMMIATLPIMCLYPFLQRYFVKGVMIGALKG